MIFFQHWNIGAYERQVYGSDMVHFMYWKSTRSLEKHSVCPLPLLDINNVLPLSSHLLKLRNLFARLRLCCFHWLHVIFLKNKAHAVLRNNVFFEWWMSFSYSKYCLFKQITSMTRMCMQAAFVKFDKALEPQFVQKCFRSLQI